MSPEKQALVAKSKAEKAYRKAIQAKSRKDMAERPDLFVPIANQLGSLKAQTHVAFNPMRKTRFVK
jgi:hypothetical protein